MGTSVSRPLNELAASLIGTKRAKIFMLGNTCSGKTTILYRMKLGETVQTLTPTHGYNVESIKHEDIEFTFWETHVESSRTLKHYIQATQAVVYVVDAADLDALSDSREALHRFLNEDALRNCPLLVLANKQDLPSALGQQEITLQLRVHAVEDRPWHVQVCSALTGEGLEEALSWLVQTLDDSLDKSL